MMHIYDVINGHAPYEIGEFVKDYDKPRRTGVVIQDLYNHSEKFSVFRRQSKLFSDFSLELKTLPRRQFMTFLTDYFLNDNTDLTRVRNEINEGKYVQRQFRRNVTFKVSLKTRKKKISNTRTKKKGLVTVTKKNPIRNAQ